MKLVIAFGYSLALAKPNKRQESIGKKKKKKSKNNKANLTNEHKMKNENLQNIDMKYEAFFSDAGLDIRDHILCKAKPDGACGSNCTALNYHHDETPVSYVRMNVNNHIIDFWPFYEPFVTFPFTQTSGSEKLPPFNDKDEYLKFLRTSGWNIMIFRRSLKCTRFLFTF